MVDEADKDGTGLLTEKEFMQSSATEVWSQYKSSNNMSNHASFWMR